MSLFIFNWYLIILFLKQIPKGTRAAWQTQKEENVKWTARNSAQRWKQTTRYSWILSIVASSESCFSLKNFCPQYKIEENLHKSWFMLLFLIREYEAMSEFS